MSLKKESRTDVQFHLAALRGDCDRIRQLLDTGKVHIDSRDRDGTTPLILSAAMGHAECVKELLAQGADPECCRTTGTGALFFAAQGGFLDVLSVLLEHSPPPSVDRPSADGGTALFVASQSGHADAVRVLLARGADVNRRMKDGASPLFIAAQNGHADVVSLLIRAGAKVDLPRTDGATPLWIAAQCGHCHAAARLLRAGAHADTARAGATPLFKAAHKGHAALVQLLLRYRPQLGLLKNGESALHGAAMFGQLDCAKLLVAVGGASVSLQNARGLRASDLALMHDHRDVYQYLTQAAQP